MTYFTQIPLMFELVLGANLVVDSTGRGGRGTQDVENDYLDECPEKNYHKLLLTFRQPAQTSSSVSKVSCFWSVER